MSPARAEHTRVPQRLLSDPRTPSAGHTASLTEVIQIPNVTTQTPKQIRDMVALQS